MLEPEAVALHPAWLGNASIRSTFPRRLKTRIGLQAGLLTCSGLFRLVFPSLAVDSDIAVRNAAYSCGAVAESHGVPYSSFAFEGHLQVALM